MGSIGDCFDNAVARGLLGRMQVELLTAASGAAVELANAIFEYLEISTSPAPALLARMRTPVEYEMLHQTRRIRGMTSRSTGSVNPGQT